jgi:hypothetical protein
VTVSATNIRFRSTSSNGIEDEYGDTAGNPGRDGRGIGQAYISSYYNGMNSAITGGTQRDFSTLSTGAQGPGGTGGHHFKLNFDPNAADDFGLGYQYNENFQSSVVSTALGFPDVSYNLSPSAVQGRLSTALRQVALYFGSGSQEYLSSSTVKFYSSSSTTRIELQHYSFNKIVDGEGVEIPVRYKVVNSSGSTTYSTVELYAGYRAFVTIPQYRGIKAVDAASEVIRANTVAQAQVMSGINTNQVIRTVDCPAGRTVYTSLSTNQGVRGPSSIRLTDSGLGSELFAAGSSSDNKTDEVILDGDHRGTYIRNPTTDPKVYYISKSLADVVNEEDGTVSLYYWLGYAKAGLENILSLPNVKFHSEVADYSTRIAKDIIYLSDNIIRKANVPSSYRIPATAGIPNDTNNQQKYMVGRAGAAGGFGSKNIPNHVEKPDIKWSHFSGAQKKPQLWECINAVRNTASYRHSSTTLSASVSGVDGRVFHETWRAKFRAMTQQSSSGITNQIIASTFQDEMVKSVNSYGNSNLGTTYTYDLGAVYGDHDQWSNYTSSNVIQQYEDYEWTTVLINHAAIGAYSLNGTSSGYFSYEGGNLGKNSKSYSSIDTMRSPTYIGGGLSAALVGDFAHYYRDNYNRNNYSSSWSNQLRQGNATGPSYDNSYDNLANAHDRWYIYHINLPISEISKIRLKTKNNALNNRHMLSEMFVYPGKWEVVSGSFRHKPRPGLERGVGNWSVDEYNLFTSEEQNLNYGDMAVYSGLTDYAALTDNYLKPAPTLTTVDYRDLFAVRNYHTKTALAGQSATIMLLAQDVDNPDNTGYAGKIVPYFKKHKVTKYESYQSGQQHRKQHSMDLFSFVLRLTDT